MQHRFFYRVFPTILCFALLAFIVSLSLRTSANQVVGLGLTPTSSHFLPYVIRPLPTPTFTATPTLTPSPTATATATNIPPTPTPTHTSAPPANVQITRIEYDPPGPDEDGEYVTLSNLGGTTAAMTNWTLRDEANHIFTFPAFTLAAGANVKVWTGSGANNSGNLYWGSGAAIWNNTGDTATLRNSNAQVVDVCTYSGGGTGTNCN